MSKHLEEAPEQTSRLDALMKTSRYAFSNHPPEQEGPGPAHPELPPAAPRSANEHLLSFNARSWQQFQQGFLRASKYRAQSDSLARGQGRAFARGQGNSSWSSSAIRSARTPRAAPGTAASWG